MHAGDASLRSQGEVNELKTLLRDQAVERDPKRKRDVIKKVG